MNKNPLINFTISIPNPHLNLIENKHHIDTQSSGPPTARDPYHPHRANSISKS